MSRRRNGNRKWNESMHEPEEDNVRSPGDVHSERRTSSEENSKYNYQMSRKRTAWLTQKKASCGHQLREGALRRTH